jgi:hypothetical protein
MQNLDEILLCKHCKEGASIVTHFLTTYKKLVIHEETLEDCPRLVVEDQDDK